MATKSYSQRELDKEVKKQTAINKLMDTLADPTSDLKYDTLMECLADAQDLLLCAQVSEDPARNIGFDPISLYLGLTHDLIKILKPLCEIANDK